MNKEQIKKMQERINKLGNENLEVDGVWGRKSNEACRRYLLSLMPHPNPWPKGNHQSLTAFYGEAGNESNLTRITFPYPMFYGGKRVTTTLVHKKCAESLLRVLNNIKELLPNHPDIQDEASDFGGIFNNRSKRGGTSKSVHAWGAAIDLDADDNTFRDSWPQNSDMPLEIIEAFAKEGWQSAAAFWNKDAMHFEATRI
jgi:hypothetical protein